MNSLYTLCKSSSFKAPQSDCGGLQTGGDDNLLNQTGPKVETARTAWKKLKKCPVNVQRVGSTSNLMGPIALEHAVRAKSAELWLRLGEPLEALAEIENVPQRLRRNFWVHKLHAAALRAAEEL
jgi:hypothetical protein